MFARSSLYAVATGNTTSAGDTAFVCHHLAKYLRVVKKQWRQTSTTYCMLTLPKRPAQLWHTLCLAPWARKSITAEFGRFNWFIVFTKWKKGCVQCCWGRELLFTMYVCIACWTLFFTVFPIIFIEFFTDNMYAVYQYNYCISANTDPGMHIRPSGKRKAIALARLRSPYFHFWRTFRRAPWEFRAHPHHYEPGMKTILQTLKYFVTRLSLNGIE